MKVYYYCPNMNLPSGGMGVLLKQAKILSDNGYEVVLLYNKQPNEADFNPTWMEFSIQHLPKKILTQNILTTIQPNDIFVIPEGFGSLAEELKYVKCKKVILAQSWIYILTSMKDGAKWSDYGVNTVISVSEGITKYIKLFDPNITIYNYRQSISPIFKPLEKELTVLYSVSRGPENEMKVNSAIKLFKVLSPYKNIQFKHVKGLSRTEFAKELGKATFCLYTDEIAGFGTLPLEAMACHTHVIGFINIGNKYEYAGRYVDFFVENGDYVALAQQLNDLVNRYMDEEIDEEYLFLFYDETVSRYSEENEINSILDIFKKL